MRYELSLNWTKVGLKVDKQGMALVGLGAGLNWTKVGLKGRSEYPHSSWNPWFELD